MPLKVLVNALPLRRGGGVTYLREQLTAVARVAPDLDLHTLVSPWIEDHDFPGHVEVVPLTSASTRFAYEQIRVPFRRADVLYCPANFGPIASRSPVVLTVHDAHYYGAGLGVPWAQSTRQKWRVKANHLAMRRARSVIAVSRTLAKDAAATVPSAAGKLRVLQCGRPEWPSEAVPVDGVPARYILTVASSAPHKRVGDVVKGWAQSLDRRDRAVSLVIIGGLTQRQVEENLLMAGVHRDLLIHLGPVVERGRLKWLYANAKATVSMSVLESLSLTPIEAASVGCPVVLSDIPVHREIFGDDALFVAPEDTASLGRQLCSTVYGWEPGTRVWDWPVSWDDHARALVELLGGAARSNRRSGALLGQ